MLRNLVLCKLLLSLFATSYAVCIWKLPPVFGEDDVKRGDAYVDKLVMEMIEERIDEYDPYKLENSVVGFSKKIIFVNVTGEAKLYNGLLTGLRTLHRAEHCILREQNNRLEVRAVLGAGELNLNYKGSVKFMEYGPSITVHGLLHYIEVTMRFSVDSQTGKEGRLLEFSVNDMRGMKVWTSGLGPLTWAMNPIISGVTRLFQRSVKNLIERKLEHHLAEKLPTFQFPIEGYKTPIPDTTESTTQKVTPETTTLHETTEETTQTITTEQVVTDEEPTVSTTEEAVTDVDIAESTTEEAVTDEEPTESTTEEAVTDEEPTESTTEEAVTDEEPTASTTEEAVTDEEPTESTTEESVTDEESTKSTTEESVTNEELTEPTTDAVPEN